MSKPMSRDHGGSYFRRRPHDSSASSSMHSYHSVNNASNSYNSNNEYPFSLRYENNAYYPESHPFPYGHSESHASASSSSSSVENRSTNVHAYSSNQNFLSGPMPGGDSKLKDKEKPCRTLFIRNVAFGVTEEQIKEAFGKYGDIRSIYSLLDNRGFVFVSFYDLRSAENAVHGLQGTKIRDRDLDIHFSVPKEELSGKEQSCDRTKNQGTLLITVKAPSSDITDSEIRTLFGHYGEIKDLRAYRDNTNQRFIEFYDSRSCVKAYDSLIGQTFKDGTIDLKFIWDYPFKSREENTHRDRRRRSRSPVRNRRKENSPLKNYSNAALQYMDMRYDYSQYAAPYPHGAYPSVPDHYYSQRSYFPTQTYSSTSYSDSYGHHPVYPTYSSQEGSRPEAPTSLSRPIASDFKSPTSLSSAKNNITVESEQERLTRAQQAQQLLMMASGEKSTSLKNPTSSPSSQANSNLTGQVNNLLSLLKTTKRDSH